MYSARMVEQLDVFTSAPPPAHGERPEDALEEDYDNVFEGLRVSQELGASVFSRAVKFDLRQHLQHLNISVVRRMPSEAENFLPCWSHQERLTLRIPVSLKGVDDEKWAAAKEEGQTLLRRLVQILIIGILHRLEEGEGINLIGAVTTDARLVNAHDSIYSFLVKQKWSADSHG